jgi:hypothetical protein
MAQPDRAALKARNRLIAMFLLFCIIDTTLIIIVQDRWAIGRILLTIVVMYFILQGQNWAKLFLMSILGFLAIVLLAMVIALRTKIAAGSITGGLIMAMIILCTAIPLYTLISTDLNRYFFYKRQEHSQ